MKPPFDTHSSGSQLRVVVNTHHFLDNIEIEGALRSTTTQTIYTPQITPFYTPQITPIRDFSFFSNGNSAPRETHLKINDVISRKKRRV